MREKERKKKPHIHGIKTGICACTHKVIFAQVFIPNKIYLSRSH